MNISVAIDGPAGAGKSTIAKKIADKYNLMYINTGSMYRAVTLYALNNNISYEDSKALKELVLSMDMRFEGERLFVNEIEVTSQIFSPYISNNVSNYASVEIVREILVQLQKKIALKYNVIMDGRDIGTVVLKDAKYKFFITASSKERAKRRSNELQSKGIEAHFQEILQEIEKRDYNDVHRKINPLTKAKDAIEIDTSFMNIDEVVQLICVHIENGLLKGKKN